MDAGGTLTVSNITYTVYYIIYITVSNIILYYIICQRKGILKLTKMAEVRRMGRKAKFPSSWNPRRGGKRQSGRGGWRESRAFLKHD